MSARLHLGDCRELLADLADNSIDSIVTDPPYGLGKPPKASEILGAWLEGNRANVAGGGVLGRDWDSFVPGPDIWAECLRVAKPGAFAIVFAGTRTLDWMSISARLGGWRVRDCGVWSYYSGMPKALNVSAAIDKQRHDLPEVYKVTAWIRKARDAAGIKNKDIDQAFGFAGMAGHWTSLNSQPTVPTLDQVAPLLQLLGDPDVPKEIARLLVELNGRKGEPGADWLARPLEGSHDTICRIEGWKQSFTGGEGRPAGEIRTEPTSEAAKRWAGWYTKVKPAWEPWLILQKKPEGTVADNIKKWGTGALNIDACRFKAGDDMWPGPQSEEHGSRWPANLVYVRKPSPAERDRGMDRIPPEEGQQIRPEAIRNNHPTLKPIALMRWLVRLTTAPGGVCLDPFMGSGTTGAAACGQGFDFIGADLDPRYVAIASERIRHARPAVTVDTPKEAADILIEAKAPTLWGSNGGA